MEKGEGPTCHGRLWCQGVEQRLLQTVLDGVAALRRNVGYFRSKAQSAPRSRACESVTLGSRVAQNHHFTKSG